MNNFEKMLAYLIPCCPVAKSRKGSSKNNIQAQVSSFEMKKGKGKTGVEFRFYNEKKYKLLSQEQKKELKEHREASGKRGSNEKPSDKKRLRRSDFQNKKKNFDKRRRTNKQRRFWQEGQRDHNRNSANSNWKEGRWVQEKCIRRSCDPPIPVDK